MPILKITAADIAKSKVVPEGWYGLEVVRVSDFITSSKGDSANVVVSFRVEGTDGKELDRYYNTKAIGMVIPLVEAVRGKKVDPEDFEFDTDELKGKKVDNKIVQEVYEGRIINKVSDNFLPYGQGKNQKTPF